jgi:hypothetical protein
MNLDEGRKPPVDYSFSSGPVPLAPAGATMPLLQNTSPSKCQAFVSMSLKLPILCEGRLTGCDEYKGPVYLYASSHCTSTNKHTVHRLDKGTGTHWQRAHRTLAEITRKDEQIM